MTRSVRRMNHKTKLSRINRFFMVKQDIFFTLELSKFDHLLIFNKRIRNLYVCFFRDSIWVDKKGSSLQHKLFVSHRVENKTVLFAQNCVCVLSHRIVSFSLILWCLFLCRLMVSYQVIVGVMSLIIFILFKLFKRIAKKEILFEGEEVNGKYCLCINI